MSEISVRMQTNREQQVLVSLVGIQTEIGLSQQIRLRPMSVDDIPHRESVSVVRVLRNPLGQPTDRTEFWQLWLQYRDYHYSRCLQWMGGNSDDAKESLSQAMFKAWNKWPDYGDTITNPKAWLTRIIYNQCMDIHRKRKRDAQKMENIDDMKFAEHLALTSSCESPESDISWREMRAYLHQAIEALPPTLRDPFILRCCQQKSYRDIAKQLALSEENLWKRVQQARTILRNRLNKYLAGENDTSLKTFLPQLKCVIPTVEESLTTTSVSEEINYKLTVICLKTLPHSWYSSPTLQGWR